MSERYTDWKCARIRAEEIANENRCQVAIRKTKEFGKVGYSISMVSVLDADFMTAEIVTPEVSK
jgi:hypothetical protein